MNGAQIDYEMVSYDYPSFNGHPLQIGQIYRYHRVLLTREDLIFVVLTVDRFSCCIFWLDCPAMFGSMNPQRVRTDGYIIDHSSLLFEI